VFSATNRDIGADEIPGDLRRLAVIDEGYVEDEGGLGPAAASALDPKTAALLQLKVPVALGRRRCARNGALAAGATKDEIADVRWRSPAGGARPAGLHLPRCGDRTRYDVAVCGHPADGMMRRCC